MSEPPAPEVTPSKAGRSLTGFYIAICVLLALACLGTWLWTLIPKWPFDAEEARRRQVEASKRLGLPVEKTVDLGDGVVIELVLIPAGSFKMGSPDNERDRGGNEELHRVRITKPSYMGRHEVTQEVWEKVMGNNPSRLKGAKNPVECVSWDDCQEFLKKLNGLGKEEGTFRLPTEAEWEWACRAGTNTPFCYGNDYAGSADYAWYDANSGRATHPVGAKKPNAWGLFDCHGNVWEWCADWYANDYYAKSPKDNPTGPPTGQYRVLRGGSWDSDHPSRCRSAVRVRNLPATTRYHNYGLRVLVVVPPRGP